MALTHVVTVQSTDEILGRLLYLGIWSGVECGLGIIAGFLATLRPLGRQLSTSFRSALGRTASPDGEDCPEPHRHAAGFVKRPIGQQDLSLFIDTKLSDQMGQVAGIIITNRSAEGGGRSDGDTATELGPASIKVKRWWSGRRWRGEWWSPPRFSAGLMTEFDRGLAIACKV